MKRLYLLLVIPIIFGFAGCTAQKKIAGIEPKEFVSDGVDTKALFEKETEQAVRAILEDYDESTGYAALALLPM